ncbi:MAG: iron ABC transporter permease [Rhodoferax sp.]|uniref:ABC transporter permease n=1 Tax=Rhodoferax sp. TaxID=50421 RepID=UPI001B7895E7|nr:iron ABC transporter permease [Rhodoferax sp.]MBP9904758.1 iron ABC transporter permease [Rhodoferax sp.]
MIGQTSRRQQLGRTRLDFWSGVMALALALVSLLLIWPIVQVLQMGFLDPQTQGFTLANYLKVLTHPYYLGALWNTVIIGVGGMVGACLLGVPLAYFTARYVIKGRSLIATLAVLALVSPPFIGAYSWVVVAGNNGWLTQQLKALGIALPTIYGLHGIILVFSLKFFPFVYLMTESALRNINRSFEEAAENLGCTRWQRFYKITLPLVFPATSSGAILCFVLSIADFGTPSIIGRDLRTLSTIAYNQYTSEMGGPPTMAVSISMLMIVISMMAVFLQRYLINKRRYAGSLTNLTVPKTLSGPYSVLVHGLCYGIVALATLPIAVVIYTSFLQTSGPVFSGGFGLNSYARVIREVPDVITNTFKFSLLATLMITLVGGLVSYIIVRRETALSGLLDSVLMVPYVVPGVVMAIGFLLTFNSGVLDLVGTATIIVLILFIRRLPYGVRATSAVLRQIKPSIEEAAISLGASPLKAFLKVTVPLMLPGVVAGAMMSFITAINELSSTLLLYTGGTTTMPVKVYNAVLDGEFGIAAALSTILLLSSGVCVYVVMRFSQSKESAFV